MRDWIINHEPWIRLAVFGSVLVLMLALESLRPRRQPGLARIGRWRDNFGLFALDVACARWLFPMAAVGVALSAETLGDGWRWHLELPFLWSTLVGFLLLDVTVYWQHRLFHQIPIFWRLHRVHHTDLDFDASTGLRFHPIEIVVSLLIKALVIVAFGINWLAVLVFEILLSSTALFNHANVRIPLQLDRYLRWLVVTPDMHRVHHSSIPGETNSNFCFNLPWWDHLFGSYKAQPLAGHNNMQIGLREARDFQRLRLPQLLLQPFRTQL